MIPAGTSIRTENYGSDKCIKNYGKSGEVKSENQE